MTDNEKFELERLENTREVLCRFPGTTLEIKFMNFMERLMFLRGVAYSYKKLVKDD